VRIAVPRESSAEERRVALTPDGVKELAAQGMSITLQAGAGEGSLHPDSHYIEATIQPTFESTVEQADLVLKVQPPTKEEIQKLKPGSAIASLLSPATNPDTISQLQQQNITAFAMDLMPRISRAQSMDVLSSMSTIAGYKAALLCAEHLPRFFPMLMTAAGTLPPARVFVIGAGVAGLQAIATCRRLGAIVEAFDVRPAVKEQIESLGGKFVGMSLLSEEAEDAGGYAKEVSGDTHAREIEFIGTRLANVDCVITTALIPGKRAPILITDHTLRGMKPGSVIVDLAAQNGGNCEATVPGETVVSHGVTVIGRTDLVASMAADASRMYSKNMVSFLTAITKDGALHLDMEDEIVKGTLVTIEGRIAHEVTRLVLERGSGGAA
jgi:NAD(P) transhydrogenase subunit alpha